MDNFVQNYAYDNAYRLINADGDWDNGTLGYNLDMSYSAAGRIEHKVMTSSRMNQSGIYNVAYDNLYNYGFNGNPYALERLDKTMTGSIEDFAWDEKGNMTYSNFKDISRYLCWTEDNRLQG
jgi:putative lipase involved disintegration of autophagic bodies